MELQNAVITDIVSAFSVYSPKGRRVQMENRACYGLSFCINGQISYTHRGRVYVEDETHAVLLPQGESYSLFGDSEGLFPVINFRTLQPLCDGIVTIRVHNTAPLLKSFEEIKKLAASGSDRARVLSLFYDIISELTLQKNAGVLAPAIRSIYSNYRDPDLTVSFFADECGISEVYFRKLFGEYFHTSPKQFIIDLRINRAKSLLSEGRQGIGAISESCGFESSAHFCRTFKSRVGMTPAQYRLTHRSEFI